MKKSSQKRTKVQESKLSPNKEFLVKFFSKNFERQHLTECMIKGFNFFLIKQCNRISKLTPTIDSELDVTCKLFQTLIANLEDNLKNWQMVPFLNDSFYMLIELLTRAFVHYNEEKPLKADHWGVMEGLLDLFGCLQKSQAVTEPDLMDMTDKQLINLNWVDSIPEIEKNTSTVMTEAENFKVLAELCCLEVLKDNYYVLVRKVFETYTAKDEKRFQQALLGVMKNALEYKKSSVVDKAIKLFCSVGVRPQDVLRNIDFVLKMLENIDQKQKSIRMYREVIEALPLDTEFSANMILDLIIKIIGLVEKTCRTQSNYKDAQKLFVHLSKLSVYLTEVTQFDTNRLTNFMQSILTIVTNIKEKPTYEIDSMQIQEGQIKDKKEIIQIIESKKKAFKDWHQSVCNPLSALILNMKKNPILLKAIKLDRIDHLMPVIVNIIEPDVQKFLITVLPGLVSNLPPIPKHESNSFVFNLQLKLVVSYANKRERISEVLAPYLERLDSDQITNFEFAACFCLLQGLRDSGELLEQSVDKAIKLVEELDEKKTLNLLLALLMITTLMNPRDYPILRLSMKELVGKLFEKPELMDQPLSFPPLATSEAFLFSKYVPTVKPANLSKLTLMLNRNVERFGQSNLQLFYYVLIELNNLCAPTEDTSENIQKPEQLKIISRMRLNNSSTLISYAYNFLDKAVQNKNSIEIFHGLIRILCICEGNTTEEDGKILSDLHNLLLEMLANLHNRYRHSYRQLVDIYNMRKKKELCQAKYSQFIQYTKDMQVVKFFSEAKAEANGKLHTWTMQVILQILLKISSKQELPQSDLLTQTHLLYLPIESKYLAKEIVDSPLFLTYVMMGIYSISPSPNPDPKFLQQIKTELQSNIPDIILLITDNSPNTQVVKFQQFDFVGTLINNLFVEYKLDIGTEDIFSFKTLNSLIDGCPILAAKIVDQFKQEGLLKEKIVLAEKRIERIFAQKKYELLDNSKTIYQLLGKINNVLQQGWFNQYIEKICALDLMDDITFSINLLKELIQLKPILKADEELAGKIFQHLAKLSQFYKQQNKDELLVLIPKLVCSLFGVIVISNDQKIPLQTILQDMERAEKSTNCLNSGIPYNQSYFRCIDCDDKKIICHGCTVNCHKGHAVVLAIPSSLANKHPCQCSAIPSNKCKLRKQAPTGSSQIMIKKDFSREGSLFREFKLAEGVFGLPPAIHAPILPPSTSSYSYGGNFSEMYDQPFHTFRSTGYANNPYPDYRDEPRFDRFTRIDRFAMDPDYMEDQQEIEFYESYQIRKARGRPPIQQEKKENPEQPQQPEDDMEPEPFEELQITKMDTEDKAQDNLIKGQSYLLQIFLQIAQDLCLSKGRKASLVQSQHWKFNFNPAVLEKFVDFSTRPFPSSSFKTRLNAQNRDASPGSPMLIRKPIAVSPNLTLILASTVLNVFMNKRILSHIAIKLPLQPSNHHGLTFQGHSVEFCPTAPNQFCIAGLHSLHIMTINPDDGTISKATPLVTYSNKEQFINKVQYLEIGVLIGNMRNWKLIASKSPTLVIQAPKDDGVVRDWHVMKLEDRKFVVPTYLLVAFTSYETIYTLQFDENDRGEKHMNNKMFLDMKKRNTTGSAIYAGYLSDGRKFALFGSKDKKDNNNIGRMETNRIQNIAALKFQGTHPALQKNFILGTIARLPTHPDKLLFCCTLKNDSNKNRELSYNSGQLTIFSLTQDEKFGVQPLSHSPNDTNCEGFAILPIDESANCIISLHEDGSVNMFVQGELKKQAIAKLIKEMDEREPGTRGVEVLKGLDQMKKVVADKIKLNMIGAMELVPLIDFRERSVQPMKKGQDYSVDRKDDELTIKLENTNKIITGLAFSQSTKVTLPTRTIDNALEVGFSNLEVMYFYALGKLKIKIEKLNNGPTRKDRRLDLFDRLGSLGDIHQQQAEMEQLLKKGYSRSPMMGISNEYQVFGESTENFLQRFKKFNDLVSEPKSDPTTIHIKEIFIILEIFLREIRDTQNTLMEQEELMVVVESFKPLLLKVDCDYYRQVKSVIELCLEIVNMMNGNPNPRIGSQLQPKTFTLEPLIKDIQNQANCNYLLDTLYDMSIHDTQRYFFWISKYRQLIKKIYKKYNLLFIKDDKFKDKEQERPIEGAADKLLCLLVASYNILVSKKESESDTLMNLIKSIFTKYAGSKAVRALLFKYIVYFYKIQPQAWLNEVVPAEQSDSTDLNELIAEQRTIIKQIEQPVVDMYAEMDWQTQLKMALEESQKQNLLANYGFIEEHKEDYEDINEMPEEIQGGAEDLKDLDGNLLVKDLFLSCMRPFKFDEPMDTSRYSIMIGYVTFKAIDRVQPQGVIVFTRQILKWLTGVKIDKQHSLTTLCYMSFFSKILEQSKFVSQQPNQSKYTEIKQQVLEKSRQIVSMDPNPNKKTQRVRLGIIMRNKSVNDANISFAHSLLGLLRGPVQLDPVILSLKCYWLLPKPKQQYKKQRDRVIYQECMLSEDISKIYKRAKKRPETWRESANIEWLEKFIEAKKPGWTQALELLALYYDG